MKSCNIYGIKRKPGELYRPSNGSEGTSFTEYLCEECRHNYNMDDEGKDCYILGRAFFLEKSDPEYPKEWCIDENGDPCCTKWEGK